MDLLQSLTVVVPFRLASQRFPQKALARIWGRTLIEHALRIGESLGCQGRLVLTGPSEDLERAQQEIDFDWYGPRVIPSSLSCRSGTDRLVEIYRFLEGDAFLTLPVDEPAIDPGELRRALSAPDLFADVDALTFYCDFQEPADYLSPHSAKVVHDLNGRLLYMSRAAIPVQKDSSIDASEMKKHIGSFVFRRTFLESLANKSSIKTRLDALEGLEQLRWLELGMSIRCLKIRHLGFGIDVPEQLTLLEERMRQNKTCPNG